MRIGEFAKKNNISIDTVRHYLELKLIVPTREGKYFQFDKRCERDLERTLEMKEMGFSLQEIKKILMLRRFSKMTTGQELAHYRDFFENKMNDLVEKRIEINKKIKLLEDKVEDIDQSYEESIGVDLGVDLGFLGKIVCTDCGESLSLEQAEIKSNMIMEGTLNCNCGFELRISEGILIDEKSMKKLEAPDESYFIKYINETNKSFLDNMYNAMEWSGRLIDFENISRDKVFLELGVGNGVFLSHIFDEIPEDNYYIAVDYDIYKLQYLKKMIERSGQKKKIVFVCSDYRRMPITDHIADYVVDFFGSTAYSYNNVEFLHKVIKNKYKEGCRLSGSFMDFNKFKDNDEMGEESFHLFKKKNIRKYLDEMGFKCIADEIIGYADEGGKYEQALFEITDRVYIYSYFGQI